mmetsp:Transcript_35904/g.56007  ORF Transcript_35904/g.56007 Transcript_35904/m.56007 type:complete len:201 (+) Transcript_35904:142-744(+)
MSSGGKHGHTHGASGGRSHGASGGRSHGTHSIEASHSSFWSCEPFCCAQKVSQEDIKGGGKAPEPGEYRPHKTVFHAGSSKENFESGFKIYDYPTGARYEGYWVEGKRHGRGTHSYAEGGKYVGEFNDDKRHGKGVYIYPDGSRFEGDFFQGRRHGHGNYKYVRGSRYEGEWLRDRMVAWPCSDSLCLYFPCHHAHVLKP